MAKLPSIRFFEKSITGEVMDFTSTVTLDQDGTFNVTIPDELHDVASDLARTNPVALTRPANSKSWRVSAKQLDHAKSFINEAMQDYLKCEETVERVIVYGHSLKVCYSKDSKGGVHANGILARNAGGDDYYHHGGELHATTSAPLYSVGLGAKIFDKVTYRRNSGETIVYRRPEFPGSHFHIDTPAKKLDAFVGLSIDPKKSGVQEMPYSDDAALFFYDAMIAMCRLAEKVEQFLGDKEVLKLAIESRTSLLPAPKAA